MTPYNLQAPNSVEVLCDVTSSNGAEIIAIELGEEDADSNQEELLATWSQATAGSKKARRRGQQQLAREGKKKSDSKKVATLKERRTRGAELVEMGRGNEGRVDSSLENNAPPSSQPRIPTPTGSPSPTLSASNPFAAGDYNYDDLDLDAVSLGGASDMSISSSLLEFAQDIHTSKDSILEGFEVLDEEREFLEDILASAPLEEIQFLRGELKDEDTAGLDAGVEVSTNSPPDDVYRTVPELIESFARAHPVWELDKWHEEEAASFRDAVIAYCIEIGLSHAVACVAAGKVEADWAECTELRLTGFPMKPLPPALASASNQTADLDLKESDLDAAIRVLEKARVLLKRKRDGFEEGTGVTGEQQAPAAKKLGKQESLDAIAKTYGSTLSKTAMKREAKRQRLRKNGEDCSATKLNLVGSQKWYQDDPADHVQVVDAQLEPNPSKKQLRKQKSADDILKASAVAARKTSQEQKLGDAEAAKLRGLESGEQMPNKARKSRNKRKSKQGPQQSAHFPPAAQHISSASKTIDLDQLGTQTSPVDASKHSTDLASVSASRNATSVPQATEVKTPLAIAKATPISSKTLPAIEKSTSKDAAKSRRERRKNKVKARKQNDSVEQASKDGPTQAVPKTKAISVQAPLTKMSGSSQALDPVKEITLAARSSVNKAAENFEQSAADDEKTAIGVAERIAAKKQSRRERARKRNKNRLSGADVNGNVTNGAPAESPADSSSHLLNAQNMAVDGPVENLAANAPEVKKQKSARKPRKSKSDATADPEQPATTTDQNSIIPLSNSKIPAPASQVVGTGTPMKQKRGSRGRKPKNKNEESTSTTPASSQHLDSQLLAVLADTHPTKTNQGKKAGKSIAPEKASMTVIDFLDGNEDNIIIEDEEIEPGVVYGDESYSSDHEDGIDGPNDMEYSSTEIDCESEIDEPLVKTQAETASTPSRTMNVVICTPSKTWLDANDHENTSDRDASVPAEPVMNGNESAFSISNFGSQDWDHSGDESAAIKVSPKPNTRLSMSLLGADVEPLNDGIPPPYRVRRSSSMSGSSRKKRSSPDIRDARGKLPSSMVNDDGDAETCSMETSRKQKGSPLMSKESPEKKMIHVNRDANGRFVKRRKGVVTDPDVNEPVFVGEDKRGADELVRGDTSAAHVEELEQSSIAKFEEIAKALSKPKVKRKRLPTKSPYFTPPVSPVKNDASESEYGDAAGLSFKTPFSKRNSTKLKLEEFADVDKDDTLTKPRSPGGLVSCIPFPPLSAPHFGLIQENLAHDPFRLLIAVTFLIRTHGKHAIPVFYELMGKYPTPESLIEADKDDIVDIIRHLGLQNQRASTYQSYANIWLNDPPVKGRRYPVRGYPTKSSGRDIKKDEILSDSDDREAWEIGHMTQGPYAIDSWRIFCRDVLRGEADGWNGEGNEDEGFQPEWMRVLPEDKELRAYLRWMWLKEGFEWDPFTGEKEVASALLMKAAIEGRIAWDEKGGMRILDEPMEIGAGLSQVGNL